MYIEIFSPCIEFRQGAFPYYVVIGGAVAVNGKVKPHHYL